MELQGSLSLESQKTQILISKKFFNFVFRLFNIQNGNSKDCKFIK